MPTGLKENDGKGAKKKLTRKLAIILVTFASVLLVIFLVRERKLPLVHRRHQLEKQDAQRDFSNNRDAGHIREMKHNPKDRLRGKVDAWEPDKDILEEILQARLSLVNLKIDKSALDKSDGDEYVGVYGLFCKVDWTSHKEDPALTPMFRDVQAIAPDCKHPHTMDLKKAADAARAFDEDNEAETPKVLETPLFVFHESRCGSTLVANILQAASPTEHRVFSESPPPIAALQLCGEDQKLCSMETAAAVFQDTIYLMSRSDDKNENKVFFKIQSVGSKYISVFQEVFPNTPWLYVYREGVEVMVSQMEKGVKHAICVQSRRSPGRMVEELAQRHHALVEQLSNVEYCALHLAALTESAVESMDEYAIPVNYKDLPGVLSEKILPALDITIGPAELHRIEQVASNYAKGSFGRYREYEKDTEKKEAEATDEVKAAAAKFLLPSFQELEVAAEQRKERNYELLY